MNAIIEAAKETIRQKQSNIRYMVDERKRLDESIISEVTKISQLERELQNIQDGQTKTMAANGCMEKRN